MLRIAKILKSNGTDGGLLLGLFDIDVEEIDLKEPVFIEFDGLPVPYFFQDIQAKGTTKAIAHLNDVLDLEDAEEMVGRDVFVEGESDEDEQTDIIGWTVLCRGETLGTVTDIEPIPGNFCIYVGEALIPLHEDFIISADPQTRTMDLDLPDGLL